MVKFLIHRPIAVIMTFIAILLLGGVAAGLLPVSLLPDIDIPEITIQVEHPGSSARELENAIVLPLRQQLIQITDLDDIKSDTRNGNAIISIRFNYGSDINYSFIDVNERVDNAMSSMPKEVKRPTIIKATASDLPVFYITAATKEEQKFSDFMELSEFVEFVLRKRLEQLDEVAMVDASGYMRPELHIFPDRKLMNSIGLDEAYIEEVFKDNNITLGSLQIIDGQYQYSIRFANTLNGVEDIENLYFKVADRVLQLKDIAKVTIRPQERQGFFMEGNQEAISLAIIKKGNARMENLKIKVNEVIRQIEYDYPTIKLSLVRDQTGVLTFAIDNLQKSLIIGGVLAFFIMFLFMKDYRSPWLIGVSIPVSLIISLLLFHLIGLSINIISLSGLILGVGMMIDNSIIVIDNISQRIDNSESLVKACISGTNEVIRPLISSVLTSCAVFIPLIFISGIAGTLFYDQAIAVAVGLSVSLLVSITLLPVLYRLLWLKANSRRNHSFKIRLLDYENAYKKGWRWVFSNRYWVILIFFFLIFLGVPLLYYIEKERFPSFKQQELIVDLDWNEYIHLSENKERVKEILKQLDNQCQYASSFVGRQQYVMHKGLDLNSNQASLYLHLKEDNVRQVEELIRGVLQDKYPKTKFSFSLPETIFERLFDTQEPALEARVSGSDDIQGVDKENFIHLLRKVKSKFPEQQIGHLSCEKKLLIHLQTEKMVLYEVDRNTLIKRLKAALNQRQIGLLKFRSQYVPVIVSDNSQTINSILRELTLTNRKRQEIPVNQLIRLEEIESFRSIYGGKNGEYIPISFYGLSSKQGFELVDQVRQVVKDESGSMQVSFSGTILSSHLLLERLLLIMLVSLALLYFILAAQFESFTQPLIVLLEVPIDIAGALALLWLFGSSLNIMAMIGMIVMSGIIINDSILKIDTINRLRRQGLPLMQAIEIGGKRRLKPILMTSLTTILALLPFLFLDDMGSQLQKPLALTVIGGMTIGTLVSLYFIPLCYYFLYKSKSIEPTTTLFNNRDN